MVFARFMDVAPVDAEFRFLKARSPALLAQLEPGAANGIGKRVAEPQLLVQKCCATREFLP